MPAGHAVFSKLAHLGYIGSAGIVAINRNTVLPGIEYRLHDRP